MANPRLRQTVRVPPPFGASLEWGTGYEALLGLSMFTGDEPQESYEVGKAWFARVRAAASRELVTALRTLAGTEGPQWFLLLGVAHEAGGAHDVERLLTHLRTMPADQVLIASIGGRLPALRTVEGQALVKAALARVPNAPAALAARNHASDPRIVQRLLAMGASEVKRLTIEVVTRWNREVSSLIGGGGAEALAADVAAKTKIARRMSPHQLVDFATGGISYDGEAGIDRVLLVPSIVTRPWITISHWESTKIICYRAGLAGATAGEPERDLVLMYRALGDETRLRLLRELVRGDRRLADLVQSLGLSKSTLHGHLAVLRSAGLIRLSLGAEKRYGLRPGLPDLNRLLADYMKSEQPKS